MTYEMKQHIKAMIEGNGWTPCVPWEETPAFGETVELMCLDMDGQPFVTDATYELRGTVRMYIGAQGQFAGNSMANLLAWRKNEGSYGRSDWWCKSCLWSPQHEHRWQKCNSCVRNMNRKDNFRYVPDNSGEEDS